MHWYNPVTRQTDYRDAPLNHITSLTILADRPEAQEIYRKLRGRHPSWQPEEALLRTGEWFREVDFGRPPPEPL